MRKRSAGEVLTGLRQSDLIEQLTAAFLDPVPRGPPEPQAEVTLQASLLQRQPDVLPRGQAVEHPADLERPHQPEPHAGHHRELGDVAAREDDGTLVGLHQPRDAVEQSRLAGAVRPDDRVHSALGHRQPDCVQRLQGAEAPRQAVYLKQRGHTGRLRSRPDARRSNPATPPGSSRTRATNSAPKYTCQVLAKLDVR